MHIISMTIFDWAILAVYLGFVIWIGFYLRKYTRTDADYFLAGRKNSAMIAGVAFMSANMGALEVIGYAGQGVKYGIFALHFYLIGAVPAMLFLGIVMMPFYYSGKIKSIPGYLKERFDEKTRVLNAVTFSIMMVLVSGIALYALALVLRTFLGWNWDMSIWLSAALVALYVTLSGLMSAIFTEVIQFFLIWAGILLLPILGIIDLGGPVQAFSHLPHMYTSLWSTTVNPSDNPMNVGWFGLIFGLGFAISFGYWTTDFLIIQRAFSAKDLRSARMAPIIGSYFKIILGFAVVGSGLVGLTLLRNPQSGFALLHEGSRINYDSVMPLLIIRYFPPGLVGVGVTALVAMFMAGQAGNMSAFNTVWTYDIYQSVINKDASSNRLIWIGRIATIVGILLSIAGAYWAKNMPTIIDYLQAIASWILAPSIAIILLGMFVKWISPGGAFWGMLIGMLSSFAMFIALQLGWVTAGAFTPGGQAGTMSANFWRAIWAWLISSCIAIVVSLFTDKRPQEELVGLVKGLTPKLIKEDIVLYKKPAFWASITLVIFIVINIYFW
jgi:solute:Na+ symporter, SSS family